MSKKNDDRENIVVVGAGHAGSRVAHLLSLKLDASKYNLIVVNPRPYTIFMPCSLRLAVSDAGQMEEKGRVDIQRIFHQGKGTLVVGKVKSITKSGKSGGTIVLEDDEEIPFRVLVLTSGSLWEGPVAFPDSEQAVKEFTQRNRTSLEKAENIVLVGGGAVGIEFAGEIKDIYPNKRVAIVHGGSALINSAYPAKFRKAIQAQLEARGIEIILNEYIDDVSVSPTSGVTTRNGRKIPADLLVKTTGPRPNTAFIAASLGPDTLDEGGYVKVQPTLQLLGHADVFSAGDIINVKEQKQLMKAMGHADIVVGNIIGSLSGRSLKKYTGSTEMILLTNGKDGGAAYIDVLWGIMFGSWLSKYLKSRTLMVKEQLAYIGL